MIKYSFDPHFELMITTWTGNITDEELVLSFKTNLMDNWNPGTHTVIDLTDCNITGITYLGITFLLHIIKAYVEYKRIINITTAIDVIIICNKETQDYIESVYQEIKDAVSGKVIFFNNIDSATSYIKDNYPKK